MAKNMKVESERTALAVLEAHWPEGTFPVDPVAIAKRVGLEVYTAQLGDDISGMLLKEQGEAARIYVDVDDVHTRQRFTVAHELGHYFDREQDGLLGDDCEGGRESDVSSFGFVDYRKGGFTLQEFFANEFAGHLLMPASEVQRLCDDETPLATMQAHFGVSMEAMRIRLKRLNLT